MPDPERSKEAEALPQKQGKGRVLAYTTLACAVPHVQGVWLNHAIFAPEEVIFFSVWSAGRTRVFF
jgi:hypothetical protein